MKLVDKILNYFEDFEQSINVSVRWIELIAILVLSRLIVDNNSSILKLSINPSGMYSHLGNLVSVPFSLFGTFVICYVAVKFFVKDLKAAKVVLLFASLLTGLVVNIVAETGSGMSLIGLPNTGDPLDILWGTLFCVLACLLSYRFSKTKSEN